MDTKSICLEEVSVEEFQRLENFWGDRRKINPGSVHSRLRNPIMADNYVQLLFMLKEMAYADQICVRASPAFWMKRYIKLGIRDAELRQMADFAAKDMIRRNYLELKLKDPASRDERRAILEFTEHEGMIVSYKARVPYMQRNLFTIKASRPFAFNNAIWVPE
ncbi:MAG: hypothetical protein QXM31_01570 [Candidatus Woesearchaeota archaeon]